jgi:predicted aldo/keto reductase-like oxidoreductase
MKHFLDSGEGWTMVSTTSRRNFLQAGLMVPVAGATSGMGLFQPAETPAGKGSSASVKPEYRVLGRTGLKVTTVGFGCMITSDGSVIERAVDSGITYFDTARSYQNGNNERMVGTALGAKRKNVVLSTKTHAPDKATMLQHIDKSLKELNTDYVDIWYLHARSKPEEIKDEMIEALEIAKQQGKTRFLGVSTHSGQQTLIPWMVEKKVFDVVLAAYNFSMDASMDAAIATAAKAGMGVVGMKVMAGGLRRAKADTPLGQKLAQPGALLAALKWVVKNPNVATTIPSITDMDQLDENLTAMGSALSKSEEKVLAAHLESIRPLYCSMCGQCEGQCQKGLPVHDVLRILTYADGYGQFALARERFLELAAEHRAVRCGDCDDCTVNCAKGVRVRERVARAQELLA